MLPRVYTCFDASGSKNPARSDLKHYFLLRAWARRGVLGGRFIDVHADAPRFDPRIADMRAVLSERLRGSHLLLLILSEGTKASRGWLHWEIDFAAHQCALPIVCAYCGTVEVDARLGLSAWWPETLRRVLHEQPLRAQHVAFRPAALARAFGAGVSMTAGQAGGTRLGSGPACALISPA